MDPPSSDVLSLPKELLQLFIRNCDEESVISLYFTCSTFASMLNEHTMLTTLYELHEIDKTSLAGEFNGFLLDYEIKIGAKRAIKHIGLYKTFLAACLYGNVPTVNHIYDNNAGLFEHLQGNDLLDEVVIRLVEGDCQTLWNKFFMHDELLLKYYDVGDFYRLIGIGRALCFGRTGDISKVEIMPTMEGILRKRHSSVEGSPLYPEDGYRRGVFFGACRIGSVELIKRYGQRRYELEAPFHLGMGNNSNLMTQIFTDPTDVYWIFRLARGAVYGGHEELLMSLIKSDECCANRIRDMLIDAIKGSQPKIIAMLLPYTEDCMIKDSIVSRVIAADDLDVLKLLLGMMVIRTVLLQQPTTYLRCATRFAPRCLEYISGLNPSEEELNDALSRTTVLFHLNNVRLSLNPVDMTKLSASGF